ncbi:MAG: DNA-binding response regulator, partial [Streptomyces sp.]
MQSIRVLVVDDHRIFAESLAAALAAEQDVEVTAAGSAPAALRCLERGAADGRRFDVLLIDADLQPVDGAIRAPATGGSGNGQPTAAGSKDGGAAGPGGIQLVSRVRTEHPAVRAVVLAERDDPRHAAAALQAGAGGWVAKDCSLSRL